MILSSRDNHSLISASFFLRPIQSTNVMHGRNQASKPLGSHLRPQDDVRSSSFGPAYLGGILCKQKIFQSEESSSPRWLSCPSSPQPHCCWSRLCPRGRARTSRRRQRL